MLKYQSCDQNRTLGTKSIIYELAVSGLRPAPPSRCPIRKQLNGITPLAIDATNQVWCYNNIGLTGGCPQTFQPSVYYSPSGDVAQPT